jgi:hypothetical protein
MNVAFYLVFQYISFAVEGADLPPMNQCEPSLPSLKS